MKHIKKVVIFIAIISLLMGLFCGMQVSGAASDWYAAVGSPVIQDSADKNYCTFKVNASAAMSSLKTENLLEKDIILKSLSVPDGGYWGLLGFRTQTQGSNDCVSDAEKGKIALLIEKKDNYLRLFFYKNDKIYEIGTLPFSEEFCLRFLKLKDNTYSMQINGKVFTHDFINSYGKKGYFRKSYVNVFASNWMSGEIGIVNRLWECETAEPMPLVYPSGDGIAFSTEAEESIIYCNETFDFSVNKVEIANLNESQGGNFSVCINKEDTVFESSSASDGGALTFSFAESGETVRISLDGNTPVLLGTVPKADRYSYRFVKRDDSYALKVNDTVLESNVIIKAFMQKNTQAYLVLKIKGKAAGDLFVCKSGWYQYSGSGAASVQINDDNSCHIEVTASQNVVAPRKYDLLTTGISISKLEIPEPNSNSQGALIYLGEKLTKAAPCVATSQEISLLIEKTTDGVSFNILNSNGGTKTLLGTVTPSEEYRIRFVKRYKRWVLMVNDIALDINTKTDEKSTTAIKNIKDFLGEQETRMVYIAFATNNYAKGTLDVFSFIPLADPEGFSVVTSGGVTMADGDETNGYTVTVASDVTVISNNIYNQTEYSLFATRKNVAGKMAFWISKTDIQDRNFKLSGTEKNENRFAFFFAPATEKNKAKITCMNVAGTGEIDIGTVDFDWNKKHAYDVRRFSDGNWYVCVDANPVKGTILDELNTFMNTNSGGELFYGLSSTSGLELSLLKISESPFTPVPIDDPGWKYFADDQGEFTLDADGSYSVSKPTIQTFAFTKGTYDIAKTSLSLKTTAVKDWLYFSISVTDASDNNPLPSGQTAPKRVAFVVVPKENNTKAQISIWGRNYEKGLTVLDTIDYDWNAVHTYDVRMGSDGHWYLWVDNKIKSAAASPMLDDFIERNGTSALRYGTGGFGGFAAEGIRIVEQTPGDNYIDEGGWNCYNGVGGNFHGDSREGYYANIQSGAFAYSKLTYDINKTALSLKIDDIGGWLYFSISATSESDDYLPVGAGDEINRVVFVITPYGMNAQFGHWAADGKSKTLSAITSYEFDWFGSTHTFDVRKSNDPEDDNWYLCVDGRLLMNRISNVLNQFMKKHDGEKLHYGVGGFTAFSASEIKIVDKPELMKGEENASSNGGTVEYTGDYDFGIDFDNFENSDNSDINEVYESDFDSENQDYGIPDFDDETTISEKEDPRANLQAIKVRKRRLITKGHGLIFSVCEIVLMIAGGALILAALTLMAIFFIKRFRKKKLS